MRILIVEDDVSIATGLKWLLEAEGMTVEVVKAASEVLPAIERCAPDLLLLDLSLSDGDGRSVYRELVHRLPIIISTGSFDFVCEHECITVLQKPFTTDQLLAAINRILAD